MQGSLKRLVRPSSRSLLARVLDEPDLPAQIQQLAPAVFSELVEQIGLEDAGELVAMATIEQLGHAFDEDLWKNQRPGEEEHFDPQRFLLWLEVLLEAGDAFAASRLVEMPEDLVTLALQKHMLVLDVEVLALDMQAADEVDARQLDKALESCIHEELNGLELVARQCEGWDSIWSVVLALDRDHHEFLTRVLERCCAMSSEYIEDSGGLYEVLTSEEMLEADLAGEREDRRAEQGHVAPSSAAAFLSLARTERGVSGERDPVTRAYFRNLGPTPTASVRRGRGRGRRSTTGEESAGIAGLLRDAGVRVDALPRRLLMAQSLSGDPAESRLVDAMRALAERAPVTFGERCEELAYLASVLLAGCAREQRSLRPIEAVRAALAACNLGLCLALSPLPLEPKPDEASEAAAILQHRNADELFRTGWHAIHRDVVDEAARVARQLLRRAAEKAGREENRACQRAESLLKKACDAGMPWRGLSALDELLQTLDGRSVEVLRGLMDQCPMLVGSEVQSVVADRRSRGGGAVRYLSTPAVVEESRRLLADLVGTPRMTHSKKEPRAEPIGAMAPAPTRVNTQATTRRPRKSRDRAGR